MPYPQQWRVSASPSAGLYGLGLTITGTFAVQPAAGDVPLNVSMPALAHSGSLFVALSTAAVALTHSGASHGFTQGTLTTLLSLQYVHTFADNAFRAGVFFLQAAAPLGGDTTFSGPCYTMATAPVPGSVPNQSTWVLEKWGSGLGASTTTVSLLANSPVSVALRQGLIVQASWVASAGGVQLNAHGAAAVVSQFASYASFAAWDVSFAVFDATPSLIVATAEGLWARENKDGFLAVFDMSVLSA